MGRGSSKGGKGGKAAGAAQTAANVSEEDAFVNEMVRALQNPDPEEGGPMSNGDLQAVVEAFAMTHPDVDEDALLDRIRSEASRQAAPLEGGHELVVKMNQGDAQRVNVSVQDVSQYENLKGADYVRSIDGSYTRAAAPVYRTLASEAERNAINSKADTFMTEPSAKAGKWTKTSDVPVLYSAPNDMQLRKGTGYATKMDVGNVYIQKVQGGWQYNYKGVLFGQKYSNLTNAKNGISTATELLGRVKTSRLGKSNGLSVTKAQFEALNRNKGRVAKKVWKEMDMDYVGGRLYE